MTTRSNCSADAEVTARMERQRRRVMAGLQDAAAQLAARAGRRRLKALVFKANPIYRRRLTEAFAGRIDFTFDATSGPAAARAKVARLRPYDLVIVNQTYLGAAEIARLAGTLRWLYVAATGFDRIAVAALNRHRILCTYLGGTVTDGLRDYTFAAFRAAAGGRRQPSRLAVVGGNGRIGRSLVFRALTAAGDESSDRIFVVPHLSRDFPRWSRTRQQRELQYHRDLGRVRLDEEARRCHAPARVREMARSRFESRVEYTDLSGALRQATRLSLNVNLTPETRNLITAARLAALARPELTIVNTCRNAVFPEREMLAAAAAAPGLTIYTDVVQRVNPIGYDPATRRLAVRTEQLDREYLEFARVIGERKLARIIQTPHTAQYGGFLDPAHLLAGNRGARAYLRIMERRAGIIVADLRRVLDRPRPLGIELERVVNLDALTKHGERRDIAAVVNRSASAPGPIFTEGLVLKRDGVVWDPRVKIEPAAGPDGPGPAETWERARPILTGVCGSDVERWRQARAGTLPEVYPAGKDRLVIMHEGVVAAVTARDRVKYYAIPEVWETNDENPQRLAEGSPYRLRGIDRSDGLGVTATSLPPRRMVRVPPTILPPRKRPDPTLLKRLIFGEPMAIALNAIREIEEKAGLRESPRGPGQGRPEPAAFSLTGAAERLALDELQAGTIVIEAGTDPRAAMELARLLASGPAGRKPFGRVVALFPTRRVIPGGRRRVVCLAANRAEDRERLARPRPAAWLRLGDSGLSFAPILNLVAKNAVILVTPGARRKIEVETLLLNRNGVLIAGCPAAPDGIAGGRRIRARLFAAYAAHNRIRFLAAARRRRSPTARTARGAAAARAIWMHGVVISGCGTMGLCLAAALRREFQRRRQRIPIVIFDVLRRNHRRVRLATKDAMVRYLINPISDRDSQRTHDWKADRMRERIVGILGGRPPAVVIGCGGYDREGDLAHRLLAPGGVFTTISMRTRITLDPARICDAGLITHGPVNFIRRDLRNAIPLLAGSSFDSLVTLVDGEQLKKDAAGMFRRRFATPAASHPGKYAVAWNEVIDGAVTGRPACGRTRCR